MRMLHVAGEVYDLLNAMEDRLGASNSAVVLAATKAFLRLTLSMPATHQQVGAYRMCVWLCGCVCVYRHAPAGGCVPYVCVCGCVCVCV